MNTTFNLKGLGWFSIVMIFIITVAVLTSCESKSGQLTMRPTPMFIAVPNEKVVIIDSYPPINMEKTNDGKMYHYKVKRISKGVMTVIYDYNLYDIGDTIYHRFTLNEE
jgi:hypothetical protein